MRLTIYVLNFPFYASKARGLGRNAPRERDIQLKRREKNKVGGTMGHDSFFCRRLGRKSDPINDALRPAVLRYAYRLNLSSG